MMDVEAEARNRLETWARKNRMPMARGLVAVDLSRLGDPYKGMIMAWKWRRSRPDDILYRVESLTDKTAWGEARTPDAALALFDMDEAMRTASVPVRVDSASRVASLYLAASSGLDWANFGNTLYDFLEERFHEAPEKFQYKHDTRDGNWMEGSVKDVRFHLYLNELGGGAYNVTVAVGRKTKPVVIKALDSSWAGPVSRALSGLIADTLKGRSRIPDLYKWKMTSDSSDGDDDTTWEWSDKNFGKYVISVSDITGNVSLEYTNPDRGVWSYKKPIPDAEQAYEIAADWHPVWEGGRSRDPHPFWRGPY